MGASYGRTHMCRHALTRVPFIENVTALQTADNSVTIQKYGTGVQSAEDEVNVSMHVNGDLSLNGKMHAVEHMCDENYVVSDRNAKRDVAALSSNLVASLVPVSYVLKKHKPGAEERPPTVGFIAQEVEKLDSTLVAKSADGRYALNYRAIGVHAVHAVQQLQRQQEHQNKEARALRESVAVLQAELARLKST